MTLDVNWHESRLGKKDYICTPCDHRRRRPVGGAKVVRTIRADHGRCPDDIHLRRIRRENKAELARLNNKQTTNPEGFVYVETNPAWPWYVKVGCALDWQDRLNGMQTGSPFRDYAMPYRQYFKDRAAAEREAHSLLAAWRVGRTEWFATTVEHARGVIQSIHLGNECKDAA